nr:MAG: hypothetical protein [Bacteriophage sp.]
MAVFREVFTSLSILYDAVKRR